MDDPNKDAYGEHQKPIDPDDVIGWLTERLENCIWIARGKSGDDWIGWMQDAAYFRAAIELCKSAVATPEPEGREG